ncbi:hypothetical protein [uncultured Paraglaciecola sp.]|uniref:hypothetical protein n=1 Tax=uncultured Paraglaciecola sp. TaxID=1765024 RepID=UPI0026109C18|nr:hypothetical protein [uncultured Paraglaciecola sp.]
MAPIISLLLSAGPSIIRMFGKAKGGKAETVAEEVASFIDGNNGKPTQAQMQDMVKNLDPEVMKDLEIGLAQIAAEREKNHLEHDLGMHQAQQTTLQSVDIKGIRPEIANRHSWFTCLYLFMFEGAAAFDYGSGANWEVATLIAAPTLAWFGFRTWDKFSKQGASL